MVDGERSIPVLAYDNAIPFVEVNGQRAVSATQICSKRFDTETPIGNNEVKFENGTVVVHDQQHAFVLKDGRQVRVTLFDPFAVDLEHMDEGGLVKAPMHGKLVAVFVKPGDRVEKGQRLAIVEAMKMEHALLAPTAGEVAEVAAEPGAQVAEGAPLIHIKTEG